MDWLERRYIADLDPRAERALRTAGQHFEDATIAEAALAEALALAPEHPAVALAHYRYHLYKHHFPEAEEYARRCLANVTRELGLPSVLLETQPRHADFTSQEPLIRFWLYGMQALAYVLLRCGRRDEARALLEKVVELDPTDQTKSSVVLGFVDRVECDD